MLYDANNLAFVLDEQGQGMKDFERTFAAALEYNGCQTLAQALEIGASVRDYKIIPADTVRDFAIRELEERGIAPEIQRAIDLEGYGKYLLSERGYRLADGGNVFVGRNSQPMKRPVFHAKTPDKTKRSSPTR